MPLLPPPLEKLYNTPVLRSEMPAKASSFARLERAVNTGGLFRVQAATVGRLVVGVAAKTGAQAKVLLNLALAHLKRSQNS